MGSLFDAWLNKNGVSNPLPDWLDRVRKWIDGSSSAEKQYESNLALQGNQQSYNSAEAEKQRQWEEQMANTQYQRAANDLRAAGLNPWLAVNSLQGSTPSASAGTSSAGSVSARRSGSEVISSLASTALSAAIIAKIVAKVLA